MTTPDTTSERSLREVLLLPAVERTRAPRQSPAFLSRRSILLVGALIFVMVIIVPLLVILTRIIDIPDVVGIQSTLAEQRLKKEGLTARIVERRFSVEKKGIVLEQSPESSRRYRSTGVVSLVVSAGTEQSILQDFVGDSEVFATQALLKRGLVPVIIEETSEMLPGTVLASIPVAGTSVTTGDSVTLRVAATQDAVPLIKYNLGNKKIAIAPELFELGGQDPTYDVALRLSSLLKASGAKVTISRSSGAAAQDALATVDGYVFINVRSNGSSGIEIGDDVSKSQPSESKSPDILASSVFELLKPVQQNIRFMSADSITLKPELPGRASKKAVVWISLGAADSPADAALIDDVQFKDSIARGIYRGIGEYFSR